jgi:outer membrane autotransporter protein
LRNDFIVPTEPPEPPEPPVPPEPPLPPDPPEPPLPPGEYPIIGPEVATYGAVQPAAQQLGLLTLGTMDQRVGDSALMASTEPVATDHGPSAWGRLFASNIDDTYRAFAAPHTTGNLSGFQTGADIWQGETIPGHNDRFGGYVAYANADLNVSGLVTNEAATGYTMQHTGSLTLHAASAGVYWTHYGPGGWYLDGVMQATTYTGNATTQYARLDTGGVGFMGSLEFGYPFSLPQLGSSFVLEPQTQAVWQETRFGPRNDGEGEVNLGNDVSTSGRLGLRGKWLVTTENGAQWAPYVAADLWRDWGGRATTVYDDSTAAPLLAQASRLELAGGVTARLAAGLSIYGSAGYQFGVGDTTNARRGGIDADVGVRYTW